MDLLAFQLITLGESYIYIKGSFIYCFLFSSISHSTVGVMSLANDIFDKIVEKNYTIPRWVLTTFKDNSADLLDHEDNTDLRIITKYVNKFNSSLNKISFKGGGDGPERATQG